MGDIDVVWGFRVSKDKRGSEESHRKEYETDMEAEIR